MDIYRFSRIQRNSSNAETCSFQHRTVPAGRNIGTKHDSVTITYGQNGTEAYKDQLSLISQNKHRISSTAESYEEQLETAQRCFQLVTSRIRGAQELIADAAQNSGVKGDFSFSWERNTQKTTVNGDITESEHNKLSDILNKSPLQSYIKMISNYDKAANGRMDEIYYPFYEQQIKDKYNQDLSDLQWNGSEIQGANQALSTDLKRGKLQPPLDVRVLKVLVKNGKPVCDESHFDFQNGKLLFKHGEIKLGETQCSDEQKNSPDFIFKMQYLVGMERWYYNSDKQMST